LPKNFNITNVQLGLVFSSFLFGYALFPDCCRLVGRPFLAHGVMLFAGVLWVGLFSALTARNFDSHGIGIGAPDRDPLPPWRW